MTRRVASALGLLAGTLAISGCGPTPPQAPLPAAMKLDSALSGIASACGLSYQTTALAGHTAPSLDGLEAAATKDTDKLASVDAENPDWIYQGEMISAIVKDSISLLGDCGLSAARARLARRTGQHGSADG
jgi:hypothetical protein